MKQHTMTMTYNNNIRPRRRLFSLVLLLLVLFCSHGTTTAELTEDSIVAMDEAWARRSIEDYNRGYRLLQHPPLTHRHAEIKYKLPMLPSDGVLLQDNKVSNSDETGDATGSIDTAATRDDEPRQTTMMFYLRGRRGDVASRP
jgi:hypothetical protein